jgi:serine/threonine protein kinase
MQGAYEILAALGRGGMGEVYRARDTKLGREVALKILTRGSFKDAESLARFRREAQVLPALNHPNIGGIYGIDEANGPAAARHRRREHVAGRTAAGCSCSFDVRTLDLTDLLMPRIV